MNTFPMPYEQRSLLLKKAEAKTELYNRLERAFDILSWPAAVFFSVYIWFHVIAFILRRMAESAPVL